MLENCLPKEIFLLRGNEYSTATSQGRSNRETTGPNVLPPELIRKGRFDEIFFADLPNPAERRAICELQLQRRKLEPKAFDLDELVAASEGYPGAEIEAAVQSAMYASFSDKKPVTTAMVQEALGSTVPRSTTRAEDIERLREWARERAVPASATRG